MAGAKNGRFPCSSPQDVGILGAFFFERLATTRNRGSPARLVTLQFGSDPRFFQADDAPRRPVWRA